MATATPTKPKPVPVATVPPSYIHIFSTVNKSLEMFDDLLRAEPTEVEGAYGFDAATEAAAAAAGKKLDLSPIRRPSGEEYVPRKLNADLFGPETDVNFICTAYGAGMPVLLYGPPGTGKTALFEAALGEQLVTMVGTAETEVSDFVGNYVATDKPGEYRWVDGPLVNAMLHGKALFIDEIALVDPRALSVVYSVMDGRDVLPISANPSRGDIKAQPGFMVFGACNPNVPGAVMSDALLSRFQMHIEVVTDWSLAKKLGVGTKIISVAKYLETQWKEMNIVAAPQIREALTFQRVANTFGEKVAVSNFIAQARAEDRDIYAKSVEDTFGADFTKALTFD